jgi:membrane protein required for colicin V production
MTPVDYFLVGIVCVSVLFGAIRGFLRESIALLGWLVGLWMAWRYASVVQPYLGGLLRDTPLQIWLARIIVLTAVVVCAWLLGSLLGYIVQRSGLTLGVDRILGGAFGLVRGAVIIGFVVMLAEAADLQGEPWWKASRLLPLGREMAVVLRGYVETGRGVVEGQLEHH